MGEAYIKSCQLGLSVSGYTYIDIPCLLFTYLLADLLTHFPVGLDSYSLS